MPGALGNLQYVGSMTVEEAQWRRCTTDQNPRRVSLGNRFGLVYELTL